MKLLIGPEMVLGYFVLQISLGMVLGHFLTLQYTLDSRGASASNVYISLVATQLEATRVI